MAACNRAWALVPLMPKELTPSSAAGGRARPGAVGNSAANPSSGSCGLTRCRRPAGNGAGPGLAAQMRACWSVAIWGKHSKIYFGHNVELS